MTVTRRALMAGAALLASLRTASAGFVSPQIGGNAGSFDGGISGVAKSSGSSVTPVTIDAIGPASHAASAQTISLNMTVGATANAMLISGQFGYSGHTGFNVTWVVGGTTQTFEVTPNFDFILTSDNGAAAPSIALVGLLSPTPGAGTLTMSFSSAADNVVMSAMTFIGVETRSGLSRAFAAAQFTAATSASASMTLPSTPGSIQVMVAAGLSGAGTPTGWNGGVTSWYSDHATGTWGAGGYAVNTGSKTFTQGISASELWCAACVVINPASALPAGTLAVNSSNSIANGLVFAIPLLATGTLTDLVSAKTAATTAGCSTDTSAGYGGGVAFPSAAQDRADFGNWQPLAQGDFTFLIFANPPRASGQNVLAGQCDSGVAGFISLEANVGYQSTSSNGAFALSVFNGASVGADDGGNNAVTRSTSQAGSYHTAFANGLMHAFAGRSASGIASTYCDGAPTTFENAAITGTYVNANQHFALGNLGNYTSTSISAGCTEVLALGWNRALSNDEMASITANPFQVLK